MLNKMAIKAARLALGDDAQSPEMIGHVYKVLNAQATLSPVAFAEKVKQLNNLARASLIVAIDSLLEGEPAERAQLERLKEALQ